MSWFTIQIIINKAKNLSELFRNSVTWSPVKKSVIDSSEYLHDLKTLFEPILEQDTFFS